MRRGQVVGFDDQREIRLLRWAVAGLLLAGLLALAARGADGPANPYLRAVSGPASAGSVPTSALPPPTAPGRAPLAGYTETAFRVAPGPGLTHCALLADTEAKRQRGLMGRRDLAGYDGMLFVCRADTTTSFYRKDTPLPLSIAWFDAAGRFVSSTDMEPCLGKPDWDKRPELIDDAVKRQPLGIAPHGALAERLFRENRLGIGAGTHITVGGSC